MATNRTKHFYPHKAAQLWLGMLMACGLSLLWLSNARANEPAESSTALHTQTQTRIVFGGDRHFPPYEFVDIDGNPAGFHVELLREVGQVMGFDVEVRLGVWGEIHEAMQRGEVDVMAMYESDHRREQFEFCEPNTIVYHQIYIRIGADAPQIQSLDDVRGRQVIVQRGTFTHDYMLAGDYGAILIEVDTEPEGLHLLASGQADCALLSQHIGRQLADTPVMMQLTTTGRPLLPMDYSYATLKGRTELVEQINAGIERLKQSGRYAVITQRWFAPQPDRRVTLADLLWYGSWILLPLLLLLCAAMLWSWSLRKTVSKHTQSLQAELAQREALQRQRDDLIARLQLQMRRMPIGCMIFNADMRLRDMNPTAERIFGCTAQQAIGREPCRLLASSEGEVRPLFEDLKTGPRDGLTHGELRSTTHDGRTIVCEWHNTPLYDSQGGFAGVLAMVQDVTDRHEAQRRLRDSEERYRHLVEHSPDAIYVAVNERFAYVNAQALALFGATNPEQLLGRPTLELYHPDFHAVVRERRLRVQAGEAAPLLEEKIIRLDGQVVEVEAAATPCVFAGQAGSQVVVRDITQRKDAQAALRRSEERLQFALDALNGGIWDWYLNTSDTFYSPGWERMLGYEPGELPSHIHSWELAVHPDDIDDANAALREHFDGNTDVYLSEHRLRTKNGNYVWILDRGKVVAWDESGRPTRMLGTSIDITQRKEAEQLLRREHDIARTQLEKLKAELVRHTRLATIGQISASIAHELRNPLGAVRNAHYYLKRRSNTDPDKWRQYMNIIEQEVNTADRIISDLMEMSRAKDPLKQQVQIAAMVRDLFERTMQEHRLKLRLSTDREDEKTVWADAGQLRQVLGNLFTNAAQAMEADGGTLRVDITSNHQSDMIVVHDDGPGIAVEHRDRIFEPLYTTRAKGTGLGLAICRQIIERHGGNIELIDAPKGAAFRIQLPKQPENDNPAT